MSVRVGPPRNEPEIDKRAMQNALRIQTAFLTRQLTEKRLQRAPNRSLKCSENQHVGLYGPRGAPLRSLGGIWV